MAGTASPLPGRTRPPQTLHGGFGSDRPGSSSSDMAKRIERIDFQMVCRRCDSFGIVFEGVEDASPSTVIQCRNAARPAARSGSYARWQAWAMSISPSLNAVIADRYDSNGGPPRRRTNVRPSAVAQCRKARLRSFSTVRRLICRRAATSCAVAPSIEMSSSTRRERSGSSASAR